MRRKTVQLGGHRVEEAQLLRLVLDLDLLQEEQRVDQIVLEETLRFATPRDDVGRIRATRRVGADQFAVERGDGFRDLIRDMGVGGRFSKVKERKSKVISQTHIVDVFEVGSVTQRSVVRLPDQAAQTPHVVGAEESRIKNF